MRVAVTGATGLVGRFLVEGLLGAGHAVTGLGRHPAPPGFFSARVPHRDFDLASEAPPPLEDQDALVHAAFSHAPGRYRGGEGDDPEGFLRLNRDGSARLFATARAAGIGRVLFLSSRAVYGEHPPGAWLDEAMALRPDTLYGAMKRELEAELTRLRGPGFAASSLRATGVYGPAEPGGRHKWHDLFTDFHAGRPIAPRVATELHGADLAAMAVRLLAAEPGAVPPVLNLSDIVLDRHDLLAAVAALTGSTSGLPAPACVGGLNRMSTERARALGWHPGGWPRLCAALPGLLRQAGVLTAAQA